MPKKIITEFVYSPIPDCNMDWRAWYDGEEENGHYGWGFTEEEAIAELMQMAEDEA